MNGLGEALVYGLAVGVVTMIALVIGWAWGRFRGARTIAHLPEPDERLRLLGAARALRRGGASLDACIQGLRREGVRADVAKSLVMDMEREQPADVEHAREGRWRGYRFRYPGNWRLTPLFPGAGEDPGISIDGVGSGLFLLVALDDDPEGMEKIVANQEKQVRDPERSPVASWGPFTGEGTRMAGVQAKVRMPVAMTVFRPAETDFPFALMEWHALEETELVVPGFEQIRGSFERET